MVAPKNHKLAGIASRPLAVVAQQPFLIRESGSGTRIAVEQLFNQSGHTLNVRMDLGSNESIKQGILGGLGIAVISMHTITRGDLTELTILDVEGFPIPWQWYVGHPKGKRLSIIAETFIEFMYKQGASLLNN